MIKTSSGKCTQHVKNREVFKANNIFSESLPDGAYVVYSYGHHFPMYLYTHGVWYRNKDRYSVSTSKHMSQASPGLDTVPMDTAELKRIINTLQDAI
jgi:hypothetical protein